MGVHNPSAAAVRNTPGGGIAGQNVQDALNELDTEKATTAALTAHTGAGAGAHAASAISNTPAGNLAATNVQAALNELDAEKMNAGQVGSANLNTVIAPGVYRFDVPTNGPAGVTYGQLLVMHGAADTITQLVGDYITGNLWTRSGNPPDVGGTGAWTAWKKVLDSSNFGGYAPTLTGGGASGTWGINISGNAASATTAAACSGNAATATNATNATNANTAAACSGNAATASAPQAGSNLETRAARAWVAFNGTGTPAIYGAYNVSSITDNGVGDWTVNFTTAMPTANYAAPVNGYASATTNAFTRINGVPLSTSFGVVCRVPTSANQDAEYIGAAVFVN